MVTAGRDPLPDDNVQLVQGDPAQLGALWVDRAPSPRFERASSPGSSADRQAYESNTLQSLGYTAEQIQGIKLEARPAVISHHGALTGHGFTKEQICQISNRFEPLEFLHQHYPALHVRLPELSHETVAKIAGRKSGNLAMEALLEVAQTLKGPPLDLTDEQLGKIARTGGRPALRHLRDFGAQLTVTIGLTPEQVVAIASNDGGKQALERARMGGWSKNEIEELLALLAQ